MQDDEKIQDLIDRLIHSQSNPGEIHVCPICEGRLQVGFGAYKRGNVDFVGITTECESCGHRMAADYLMQHPAWLKKA